MGGGEFGYRVRNTLISPAYLTNKVEQATVQRALSILVAAHMKALARKYPTKNPRGKAQSGGDKSTGLAFASPRDLDANTPSTVHAPRQHSRRLCIVLMASALKGAKCMWSTRRAVTTKNCTKGAYWGRRS